MPNNHIKKKKKREREKWRENVFLSITFFCRSQDAMARWDDKARQYELDAARRARREELLLLRVNSGELSKENIPSDVKATPGGLRNEANAIVFRFLVHVAEHLETSASNSAAAFGFSSSQTSHDGGSKVVRTILKAARAVKATATHVSNAEVALQVKGIGPGLANMLDRSLFHLYPQEVVPERTEPVKKRTREGEIEEEEDGAATVGNESKRGKGRKKKPYRPQNGTANYAFLVCLHKLLLEGKEFVLKQDLIRLAESSGLASKSMSGTASASQGNRHANWYNGWSCFSQMKKRDPPLVHTWSNPLKCWLTSHGEKLAEELHWNAHERQMCSCNLLLRGGGEKPDPPGARNVDAPQLQKQKEDEVGTTQNDALDESDFFDLGTQPSLSLVTRRERGPGNEGAMEMEASEYKRRLEAFKANVWKFDVHLPPLQQNQKFSDVYEVVLLLDTREQLRSVKGGQRAANLQYHANALKESGIKVEICKLEVGDITWVARRKADLSAGRPVPLSESYALDYVIERKSCDDLMESIKSGRYGLQRHLLKKSGYSKVMYLVEGDVVSHNNAKALKTACAELQIEDGFTLLQTSGVNDTIRTYKNLTKQLQRLYSDMRGPASPGSECTTMLELENRLQGERTLTAEDVFKLQLQHVPGIGVHVAEAIVRLFPSPMRFWSEMMTGDGGQPEDIPSIAKKLKALPLSAPGVYNRTIGENKAKKILNVLFKA